MENVEGVEEANGVDTRRDCGERSGGTVTRVSKDGNSRKMKLHHLYEFHEYARTAKRFLQHIEIALNFPVCLLWYRVLFHFTIHVHYLFIFLYV